MIFYSLMNWVSMYGTFIEAGLVDNLHGSESGSRDKSFESSHYSKKMKGGKRDGNPRLQTFKDKSCILHCYQWIKKIPHRGNPLIPQAKAIRG